MDPHDIFTSMFTAFKTSLEADLVSLKPQVESEASSFLNQTAPEIASLIKEYGEKKISEEQLKTLLEVIEDNFKERLLTIEGLAEVALKHAVDASLVVAKSLINKAIGFALL